MAASQGETLLLCRREGQQRWDLEAGMGRLRAEVARLQLAVGGYQAGKRVDPAELDRALGGLDR